MVADERAGLFIDVQNLYKVTKSVNEEPLPARINYAALHRYFSDHFNLIKAVAFTCADPEKKSQSQFITAVASNGFRVFVKPVKRMADRSIKANCDMEMALEVLRTAQHLDVVILVTGDSDFEALVDELSNLGKQIILVYAAGTCSMELLRACDQKIKLEEIPNAIELRSVPTTDAVPGVLHLPADATATPG